MGCIDQILKLADAYLAVAGVTEGTLSRRVFDDGKKLAALRSGSGVQVRRAEEALRWFSRNWPTGAAWPADVPRPEISNIALAG